MAVAPIAKNLFDDFLVIGLKSAVTSPVPTLLYCFRTAQGQGGAAVDANNVALMEFCFPDVDDEQMLKLHSESFAFTLTHGDGTRTFGFSRRLAQPPGLPVCLCVLSQRPWFSLFMHMLDILQLNYNLTKFVPVFINAAHRATLPPPGGSVLVGPELAPQLAGYGSFRLHVPEEERPTGVSFEPLLTSLGAANLLRVLAALMREQRLVFVSSRWAHVSSCAHAALTLLYPLQWQHIFIPVLPKSKFSYASAPMPFVVGVLARHLPLLQREAIDPEVIFVDLDNGTISADDADTIEQAQLPRPLRDELQARLVQLQRQAKARSARLDNAALAEAVLHFMVQLLGPYRQHVRTSSTAGLVPSRGELHPVRLPLEHRHRGCNPLNKRLQPCVY